MSDDTTDNLTVAGFKDTSRNVYTLLAQMSAYIRRPFTIFKYIVSNNRSEIIEPYAIYRAELSYFNTQIYLIKNYIHIQDKYSLFDEANVTYQYWIPSRPRWMYILMIYSYDVHQLSDVQRLIGARTLVIELSLIQSQNLITRLHNSIEILRDSIYDSESNLWYKLKL